MLGKVLKSVKNPIICGADNRTCTDEVKSVNSGKSEQRHGEATCFSIKTFFFPTLHGLTSLSEPTSPHYRGVKITLRRTKFGTNLMFIGPCIFVIVEELKTNLMSLAILFHFLCAQHVSDINISIIRSLRLFC